MFYEKYNRGKQATTIHHHLIIKKIKDALGVDELIRIPEKDYPSAEMKGNSVVHVNLPITYSRLERIAALPRIIQSGYFKPPDSEKLPVLSYQSIWKAKVIDFIPHVSYDTLPPTMFTHFIIGKAANTEELKKLVLSRYKKTLPLSTNKEILNQGLSITYLSLEEMVSLELEY